MPRQSTPIDNAPPVPADMPRELSKVVLPTYVIEPPDILVIEAIHIVPKPPYRLRTSDIVTLQVQGTLPDAPISGAFVIEPGGQVNLGVPYGTVKITGMTSEEAQSAIEGHLHTVLREPIVSVSLLQMSGTQQIAGQHLVAPDGTVTLGSYGSVSVVGLSLKDAKFVIERHLSQFLESPEVALDVFAYNSKVYYVITQGAGLGDRVTRFPVTGNETVLDALANINGLSSTSSTRMWIARPTPHTNEIQILPVDWAGVTAQGAANTNYQIMPGDRVFVAEDRMVAFDTGLGKLLSPFERIMGFTTLGVGTAGRLSGRVLQNNGNNGFNNGFNGGF